MKVLYNQLATATVIGFTVVLYAVSILSLDFSFIGAGFSPFKSWSPVQTAYFVIIGFVLLSLLIFYDTLHRKPNLRGLVHILPILGLSFLILFSIDSRQVLQYLPYLQVFLFNEFGSLFLFGGLLAVYIAYLVSDKSYSFSVNSLSEFGVNSILVTFFGSILLGTAISFGISLCLSLGLDILPFYGEGTIGSILVVSVLLGVYIAARILGHLEENDLSALKTIRLSQVLAVSFEFIVAYLCVASGFSLIGGLVTDGVPIPELIPISLVVLGFYALIPFSILLIRHKVLTMPPPVDE